jgi:UDP-2-acetamido-3-amino-2,3-dideoxy-glucuronate N-acetyltransferase
MSTFTDPIIHHPATIDPSVMVGENCVIWQGATVCADAVLGEGVVIGSHAWVGRGVQIGNFTRIQHGAFIPNHTVIGQGCFLGPNVTLTDDKYPKAGKLYRAEPPILENDCSLGAGAVILPGVRIGRGAMVGAGAVVTQDVTAFSTVYGCPARCSSLTTDKE